MTKSKTDTCSVCKHVFHYVCLFWHFGEYFCTPCYKENVLSKALESTAHNSMCYQIFQQHVDVPKLQKPLRKDLQKFITLGLRRIGLPWTTNRITQYELELQSKECKIEREIQKAKNLMHSSKHLEAKLKSHWLKARKFK